VKRGKGTQCRELRSHLPRSCEYMVPARSARREGGKGKTTASLSQYTCQRRNMTLSCTRLRAAAGREPKQEGGKGRMGWIAQASTRVGRHDNFLLNSWTLPEKRREGKGNLLKELGFGVGYIRDLFAASALAARGRKKTAVARTSVDCFLRRVTVRSDVGGEKRGGGGVFVSDGGIERGYHLREDLRFARAIWIASALRKREREPASWSVMRHCVLRSRSLMVSPYPAVTQEQREEGREGARSARTCDRQGDPIGLIAEEASASFDLSQVHLIRGRSRGGGRRLSHLLITMHHIFSDGFSLGILGPRTYDSVHRLPARGSRSLPGVERERRGGGKYALWARS